MVPIVIVQRLSSFLLTLGETNMFRGIFKFIFFRRIFFNLFQRIPVYSASTLVKIASQKIHKSNI